MNNKQKDYWDISKRNFIALSILMILSSLTLGVLLVPGNLSVAIVILVALAILFSILAILFKKHSPYAITIAYVYIALVFVYGIVTGFILNSPFEGLFTKIISFLVLFYIFDNVRKASKQTVTYNSHNLR